MFTYLGGTVSKRVRIRRALVMFKNCGILLYEKRFNVKLERAVYKSYVRPVILSGSETWSLKKAT